MAPRRKRKRSPTMDESDQKRQCQSQEINTEDSNGLTAIEGQNEMFEVVIRNTDLSFVKEVVCDGKAKTENSCAAIEGVDAEGASLYSSGSNPSSINIEAFSFIEDGGERSQLKEHGVREISFSEMVVEAEQVIKFSCHSIT